MDRGGWWAIVHYGSPLCKESDRTEWWLHTQAKKIHCVYFQFSSVQFSSVTLLCPTLCDPMDCSTPGFPVHHQLLELTQTHVHSVSDAIQPSHPLLLLPSIFTKIWVFFKWIRSSHQVAKVLEFQLQHQSFQKYLGLISFRMGCWVSLLSKGLSRVFSNTTVQKHEFFCTQLSSWSKCHSHTRLLEKS